MEARYPGSSVVSPDWPARPPAKNHSGGYFVRGTYGVPTGCSIAHNVQALSQQMPKQNRGKPNLGPGRLGACPRSRVIV